MRAAPAPAESIIDSAISQEALLRWLAVAERPGLEELRYRVVEELAKRLVDGGEGSGPTILATVGQMQEGMAAASFALLTAAVVAAARQEGVPDWEDLQEAEAEEQRRKRQRREEGGPSGGQQ